MILCSVSKQFSYVQLSFVGVPPRLDTCVIEVNKIIRDQCKIVGADFLESNIQPKRELYRNNDDVHLSHKKGLPLFLQIMEDVLPKERRIKSPEAVFTEELSCKNRKKIWWRQKLQAAYEERDIKRKTRGILETERICKLGKTKMKDFYTILNEALEEIGPHPLWPLRQDANIKGKRRHLVRSSSPTLHQSPSPPSPSLLSPPFSSPSPFSPSLPSLSLPSPSLPSLSPSPSLSLSPSLSQYPSLSPSTSPPSSLSPSRSPSPSNNGSNDIAERRDLHAETSLPDDTGLFHKVLSNISHNITTIFSSVGFGGGPKTSCDHNERAAVLEIRRNFDFQRIMSMPLYLERAPNITLVEMDEDVCSHFHILNIGDIPT